MWPKHPALSIFKHAQLIMKSKTKSATQTTYPLNMVNPSGPKLPHGKFLFDNRVLKGVGTKVE